MSWTRSDGSMLPVNQSLLQTFDSSSQHCGNHLTQSGFSLFRNQNDWNQYELVPGSQHVEVDSPGIQICVPSHSQPEKFIQSSESMQQSTHIGSMQYSAPVGRMQESSSVRIPYAFHGSHSALMPVNNDTTSQGIREHFHLQRYSNNQQTSQNFPYCLSPNHSVCYILPGSQCQVSPRSQCQLSPMSYSSVNDQRIFCHNQHPISPPTASQSLKETQFPANPLSSYSRMPAISMEEQTLQSQTALISRQHINESFSLADSYMINRPDSRGLTSTTISPGSDFQIKYGPSPNNFADNTSIASPSQVHITHQQLNLSLIPSEPQDVKITSSFSQFANSSSMQERFQELVNSSNSANQNYITQSDVSAAPSSHQQLTTFVSYRSSASHKSYFDDPDYHNFSSLSDSGKEFHDMGGIANSLNLLNSSVEERILQMQQENLSKLLSPAIIDFNQIDTLTYLPAEVQDPCHISQLSSTGQTAEPIVEPSTACFTRKLVEYEQISPPITPSSKQRHGNLSTHSPSSKQFSPLQQPLIEPSNTVECERSTSKMQRNLSKSSLSSLSSFESESIVNKSQNSLDMSRAAYLSKTGDDDVSTIDFQIKFVPSPAEYHSQNGYQEDKQDLYENQSVCNSLNLNDGCQYVCAESLSDSSCPYNFEISIENSNGDSDLLSLFSDECNVRNISGGESHMSARESHLSGNTACGISASLDRQQLDINSASLSHLEHFVGSTKKELEFGSFFDLWESESVENLVSKTLPQTQNFTSNQQQYQTHSQPSHLFQQQQSHQTQSQPSHLFQQQQSHQTQSQPSHLFQQQQSQLQHLEWNNIALKIPEQDLQNPDANINLANSSVDQSLESPEKKRKICMEMSQRIHGEPVVAGVPFQKKRRGRPGKSEQMYKDETHSVIVRKQQELTNYVNDFSLQPIQQHFCYGQGSFQQLLADDNSELSAEFSIESDLVIGMENSLKLQSSSVEEQFLQMPEENFSKLLSPTCIGFNQSDTLSHLPAKVQNVSPNLVDLNQLIDSHANEENVLLEHAGCNQFLHNTQYNAALSQPPPQLHQHQQIQHEVCIEQQPSPEFNLSQVKVLTFETVNPDALLQDNTSPQFEDYLEATSEDRFDVTTISLAEHNSDKLIDHEHVANTSNSPSDTDVDVDKVSDYILNASSILELIRYRQKSPKSLPAYTYRFEVPTSVFKRLKQRVINASDTKKHPSEVVRMLPQDAQKCSLLKIGKEIIQLDKLSEYKIKDIQDNLKGGLPVDSTPSIRQACVTKKSADKTTCAHILADCHSNGDLIKTSHIGSELSIKSTLCKVRPAKEAGWNSHIFMKRQQKSNISKVKKTVRMYNRRKLANIQHLMKFRRGLPFSRKGYFGRRSNVKMKKNHPKLGPAYKDDGKNVRKDINLTDVSEGVLTPIRGRTSMAGSSPAHNGDILSDVKSQIHVLLETNFKDLKHNLDLNLTGTSHVFVEECSANKKFWKQCNEEDDYDLKEIDVEFDSDLGIHNKHALNGADKCYKSCQNLFLNEFESYIELKHSEQNEVMEGVDISISGIKPEDFVTDFEELLQTDLLKRIEDQKELQSNEFGVSNVLNCDKLIEKPSLKNVPISNPYFQNNGHEVKNDSIVLTKKLGCLDGPNSDSCKYQDISISCLHESSASVNGNKFFVSTTTNVAKRRQSSESADSSAEPGKRQMSQSSSHNSSISRSDQSSTSSSFDTDNRKKYPRAKKRLKKSCKYDSDVNLGDDYIAINKFKCPRELRVMVNRLVVSDRELNIHKLELTNMKKNGCKRRNSTDCVFKKTLPKSVSINVQPNLKATGFSAEFEKFLASRSWEYQPLDSDAEDCESLSYVESVNKNPFDCKKSDITKANLDQEINKSCVVKKLNEMCSGQNPDAKTTCQYLEFRSSDKKDAQDIEMLVSTIKERDKTENEHLQPSGKCLLMFSSSCSSSLPKANSRSGNVKTSAPRVTDFCNTSDEACQVSTIIESKNFKHKAAKPGFKKKRNNTIHDGQTFSLKSRKRKCLQSNGKPNKPMCTLSVLHDAKMENVTNLQIFNDIDTSACYQLPIKSNQEISYVDSPFCWQPRIKSPDFELYTDRTDDHVSVFKDTMYNVAFLSPMSTDASKCSPPQPLSPSDTNKFEDIVEQQFNKSAESGEQKMTIADIFKSVENGSAGQVQLANTEPCMGELGESSCEKMNGHILNNNISNEPKTPYTVIIAHTATPTLQEIKSSCRTAVENATQQVAEKANVIHPDFSPPDLGPPICLSFPGIGTIENGSPPKLTPNSNFNVETEIYEVDHCVSLRSDNLGSMPPLLTPSRSRFTLAAKELLPGSNDVLEHSSYFSLPLEFDSNVTPEKSMGASSFTGSINVIHSEEFSDISDGEECSHKTDFHRKNHRNEWVKSKDVIALDGSFAGRCLNSKNKQ